MTITRPPTTAAWLAVILLACPGCPRRTETIRVAQDGAVAIEFVFEGSEEELVNGDAMPSPETGWEVSRSVEVEDDKEKHTLLATQEFQPGEDLPATFAAHGDPDRDIYLQFPTSVRIEERNDGTYYYFHRQYPSRPWQYIHYFEEIYLEDESELVDKPVEELTEDERMDLISRFAAVEAQKQLVFTNEALAECTSDPSPVLGLLARQALVDVYEAEMTEEAWVKPCSLLSEEERIECFEVQAQRVRDMAYERITRSLTEHASFTRADLAAFDAAYGRAARRYELTGELRGHHFEVKVVMPGEIVAHNADDVTLDDEEGTAQATWAFDGRAFRDREQELWFITRLDHDVPADDEVSADGVHNKGT